MTLVQRRNQPHLWVHSDLEVRLRLAEVYLGRVILLGNVKAPDGIYLAGWRSDASTRYLWDLFLHHGGNTASNPDSGPLTHSRGVGADLLFYGADVLAACKRAGIVINYVKGEHWHIQLANYTRYPIIRTNALATNGLGVPITAQSEQGAIVASQIIRFEFHGGDLIERTDGAFAFFRDTTVGNQLAQSARLATPAEIEASRATIEMTNNVWNGTGAPDMKTMVDNPGVWFKPIAAR